VTIAAGCYFTDLCRLNENGKRGAPSKELAKRERARSALVTAFMASYDVSTNPMAAEGEKMNSVQNRRRAQVEEWWHSSAGEAEELRVVNKWSAGVKPNILKQTLQVNSGAAAESVGGEGGGVKAYTEEDEEKHYDYKDEAIDVLRHSYMHVWATQGQHIEWRTHKQWI